MSKTINSLGIFSGECLMGIVGQPTPYRDIHGSLLFVGDICFVFTVNDEYRPEGLTAVVGNDFETFTGGRNARKSEASIPFIMGIRPVDLNNPEEWRVLKVKDHQHVIPGEHWPDFGFSYREVAHADQ